MAVSWTNIGYYGKKTKRYFKYMDTILLKLLKKAESQGVDIDPLLLEQIVMISGRQQGIVRTLGHLLEGVELNQRFIELERLIKSIPAEQLSKSSFIDDWRSR